MLAKWVTPYLSPRLASVEVVKSVKAMTVEEPNERSPMLRAGTVPPPHGWKPRLVRGRPMISRSQRREATLRRRWLEILQAELLQREKVNGGERREYAIAELATVDVMGERLRAAPNYRPPTEDEAAALERDLDEIFKRYATSRAT